MIIKVKNKFLYNNAELFYFIGVFLLLLLLIVGTPINNSKCWFVIPGIGSIQPSEFMKISIMLMLSKMIFNYKKSDRKSLFSECVFIFKCLLILVIPSILTFLQPDTGAVIIYIVIFTFMMFYFL